MKAKLVRTGNSRGIRIPKAILEQCQFGDEVELEVRDNCLVISRIERARGGWDAAFKEMAANKDDSLLDAGTMSATGWEQTEWEW